MWEAYEVRRACPWVDAHRPTTTEHQRLSSHFGNIQPLWKVKGLGDTDMYTDTYIYMYKYMFVLWCRAMLCVARRCWLVGWVGVVWWCRRFELRSCRFVVLWWSLPSRRLLVSRSSCWCRVLVLLSPSRRVVVLVWRVFLFRMISVLQRARAERLMIELALFSKWLRSGAYMVNLWGTW